MSIAQAKKVEELEKRVADLEALVQRLLSAQESPPAGKKNGKQPGANA